MDLLARLGLRRRWFSGMPGRTYALFLRYLLIVLIPIAILLVMGVVSVVVNRSYVSRRISESNFRSLLQIEHTAEQVFDELDSIAISFGASPEFLSSVNQVVSSPALTFEESKVLTTIRDFVEVSAYARPYVHSVYVYTQNEGNQVLTTSDGIVPLDSFYDRRWFSSFEQHVREDTFWTETRTLRRYPSVEKGEQVLSLYRRVFSLTGVETPGVVVINIRLEYFRDLIDRFRSDPEQQILIVDGTGQTILSVGPRTSTESLGLLLPLGDEGPSQYVARGDSERFVVNEVRALQNGWYYVALTPRSQFYRASWTLRNINIAIVSVSFFIGVLLAYYVSRRSFRHIEDVAGIVDAAETGGPLPEIPENEDGVYGHLIFSILRTFVENEYMKVQLSERKYRQRTLELLALHAQMNPHFLFNTLETINWRVIKLTGRPNQINELIGTLSDILKYSLRSPFELETLENEVKHAEDYLVIQRIRYRDKFTFQRDTPPNLGRYKVIRLLLQPLLENAIYHGIREKEGQGHIRVGARKVGDTIRIEVEDDGRGIAPDELARITASFREEESMSEEVGLKNTCKRVALAFGEPYGLKIVSVLGKGTLVTVTLPASL